MTGKADTEGRQAFLKINLTLHVGAARPDGYHPLTSLCVFAAGGDRVRLGARVADFDLVVTGPEAAALANTPAETNLILRAARLLASRTQLAPRRLHLDKRVPVAGGVAGGTADAAAALVLLNEAAARPLPRAALIRLSRDLGADGPVCTAAQLTGGGAWSVSGDGDRVRRVPGPAPLHVVLANPRVPVSTGAVFRAFDAGPPGMLTQPQVDLRSVPGMLRSVRRGRNDLQPHAERIAPVIASLQAALVRSPGCLAARMSGSGATVFGLFPGREGAARAARRLRAGGHWTLAAPLAR